MCVVCAAFGCVIVDTFSVKLQTNRRNIEENEHKPKRKKFIKPLDNVRSDSVHRDRSYRTVVLRLS